MSTPWFRSDMQEIIGTGLGLSARRPPVGQTDKAPRWRTIKEAAADEGFGGAVVKLHSKGHCSRRTKHRG
jgi:hypothetical protein